MSKALKKNIRQELSSSNEAWDQARLVQINMDLKLERNVKFFWKAIDKVPLQSDRIAAWKFCILLHRTMRYGHPDIFKQSFKIYATLHQIADQWQESEAHLDQVISAYCSALIHKNEFHRNYGGFLNGPSSNLNPDANTCFQLCSDTLELLAIFIHLQYVILETIRAETVPIASKQGQSRLISLTNVVEETYDLYKLVTASMFELCGLIPSEDFDGIGGRFFIIFDQLKSCFSNLESFSWSNDLITIPSLPDSFPSFYEEEPPIEPTAPPAF